MRKLALIVSLVCLSAGAAELKTSDGVALHYEVIGKGAPVIVLSGGPGFASAYMLPVAQHLAARRAAVLVDQRGTGASHVANYDAATINVAAFVADLDALRMKLGAEKITIAGHSWGGMLAMSYAAEHPDRVAALVLLDSGGPSAEFMLPFVMRFNARVTREEQEKIAFWDNEERRKENPRRATLEILKLRTPAYFHDRARSAPLTQSMNEDSFEPRVFLLLMDDIDKKKWNVRDRVRKLAAPVLVLQGDDDPVGTFEELRELFPASRAAMIAGAGHFPWLEAPAQFWAAVDDFLDAR